MLDKEDSFCYLRTQDNMINAMIRKSTRISNFRELLGGVKQ